MGMLLVFAHSFTLVCMSSRTLVQGFEDNLAKESEKQRVLNEARVTPHNTPPLTTPQHHKQHHVTKTPNCHHTSPHHTIAQVKEVASAKHLQTLADVREKHAADMEVSGYDGNESRRPSLCA